MGRGLLQGLAIAGLITATGTQAEDAPTPTPAASEPKSQACQVTLDGSQVLKRAHERGLKPRSDCLLVDLAKNQFYAPSNVKCTVTLEVMNWLRPDWDYVALSGAGRFTSSVKDGEVAITIESGGGFTLRTLSVSSARGLTDAVCKTMRTDDVMK
jgi:hypothetical protein